MNYLWVIGRSRSGTTITWKLLNKHPDITLSNQSRVFVKGNRPTGDTIYIGDKTGIPEKFLRDIKYIHVYRDGRDSVASGMRMNYVFGKRWQPWKDMNPYKNSKDWADSINRWNKTKIDLDYLDIKFEDYIDYPEKNSKLMAKFLEVDNKPLIKAESSLIDIKQTHRGCYKKWCPNWEETFHPDAIELLKELYYI